VSKVAAALIEEAFITPIRSAFMVDDQFPTFPDLISDKSDPHWDKPRARELYSFLRSKGLMCDIENVAAKAEGDRLTHLGQCDLLIADFHLNPKASTDPSAAIHLLGQLAESDHFNLAIVYTAADTREVLRQVGFSLGGGLELAAQIREKADALLDELAAPDFDALLAAVDEEMLGRFLAGKSGDPQPIAALAQQFEIPPAQRSACVSLLCEKKLRRSLPLSVVDQRKPSAVEGSFMASTDSVQWIRKGNLFAAIANKKLEPDKLLEVLKDALVAWDPPALQVMMVQARAQVEKAGVLLDEKVLNSPREQSGWLLRVLLASTADEQRRHLAALYERMFGRLFTRLTGSISEFGLKILGSRQQDSIAAATELVSNGKVALKEVEIYHAANEHLCFDAEHGEFITSGTIFKRAGEAQAEYWVCTSPACDLVPGQGRRGWDADLKPWRAITAARLRVIVNESSIGRLLTTATRCRHIFIHDERMLALEVADDDTRQMELEMLLIENDGRIDAAQMRGQILRVRAGAPATESAAFAVLGRLRYEYASRFLAESGQQRARIGVDFIDRADPGHGKAVVLQENQVADKQVQ